MPGKRRNKSQAKGEISLGRAGMVTTPKKPINSPSSFKDSVNPKKFSFSEESNWSYGDRHYNSLNRLPPARIMRPHLVLKDGEGLPRFVLCYERSKPKEGAKVSWDTHFYLGGQDFLAIKGVQAERTKYFKDSKGVIGWSPELEKKAISEFKASLGGTHPAEFLLSEFILRNREAINQGVKIFLVLRIKAFGKKGQEQIDKIMKNYKPLISRFFSKKPEFIFGERGEFAAYQLNPNKKRVKRILGH